MEHIALLRELVESDRWIDRVRAQRNHLPEITERTEIETALRGLLTALTAAQSALQPVADEFARVTNEATTLRDRAARLDASLAASTAGPRELESLQKEVTHVRELLSAVEDKEVELMLAVEPLETQVHDIKSQAQPLGARRTELTETIAELQASLDEEIAALVEQRNARAAAVPVPWLARYEAALRRAGTSGAAFVDAGKCDGCRIALAPLDIDRFKQSAQGDLIECPECGRLLLP